MSRGYAKDNSGISAETVDNLERMLSFTGSGRYENKKKVLSTVIYTSLQKRAVGKRYNWQGVVGGLNKVIPESLIEARTICEEISHVAPITEFRKSKLLAGAKKRSIMKRVPAHHAGFEKEVA